MEKFIELERVWSEYPSEYLRGTGVTDQTLHAAEEYLGGKFPQDYADFLVTFGMVDFMGAEFLGMNGQEFIGDRHGYAIFVTEALRPPNGLLCVMTLGYDFGSAVISIEDNGDECVYEWFPKQDIDFDNPVASSFLEFLHSETLQRIRS